MSVHKKSKFCPVPQLQAQAILTQASPVSGTKYTVIAATNWVRIYLARVVVTWTVQPDPLELHMTIDGNAIDHILNNPVSGTSYYPYKTMGDYLLQPLSTFGSTQATSFLWEGRNVKVEAETTGGTVSNLSAGVTYGKW